MNEVLPYTIRALGLAGLRVLVYNPVGETLSAGEKNYEIEASQTARMDTGGSNALTSIFGTPVFSNVILETPDQSLSVNLECVLITVNRPKNIVKTPVQGRDGTIKEFISNGDFMINLKGTIAGTGNVFPFEQTSLLNSIVSRNTAMHVVSEFIRLFGVTSVVIESANFSQKQGFQNIVLYDINMTSDEEYQWIIDE
jgi:hypothetical protein